MAKGDILIIPHGAAHVDDDMLAEMTEAERVAFFEEIAGRYCRHCGRKQTDWSYCQCWNDE